MAATDSYFCKTCGQPLPNNAPRRIRVRPGEEAQDPRRQRRIIIVASLLVIGVLLLVAIVMLGSSTKQATTHRTPSVTVAPSVLGSLQAAGGAFTQQLSATNAHARTAPLDLPARRADAQKDLRGCQNFLDVITGISVPAPMTADAGSLVDVTKRFCDSISAVAASDDETFNAALQKQIEVGFEWNQQDRIFFRDLRRFSAS